MGMRSVGGEIVQVQGGHIVRSTGRKDRHSKVYTAKGPRDRRVRLSAHTAIQFYDVQDRLGYDRPSKAVDWLIKKAKSAIDKLAELPPWHPTGGTTAEPDPNTGGSNEMSIAAEQSECSGYNFQLHRHLGENPDNDSSFIPPSMDSDPIDDTMKSFFPTSSASSSINFQSYPPEIIQRNTNPTQDLGLSLHSFQDQTPPNDHNFFSGTGHVGFETNFQRIVGWNSDIGGTGNRGGGGDGGGGGGRFVFNAPPLSEQSLFGQSSTAAFAQRGTLQSSFSPSIRAWDDLPVAAQRTQPIQQSSVFGTRFASDGLPMFCIPARIQGEDEEHGVVSDRPSCSSSPNSAHH